MHYLNVESCFCLWLFFYFGWLVFMSCVNYVIEKKLVVQLINFLHFRLACISEIKGIVAVSWNPSCENKIRSNKLLEAETCFLYRCALILLISEITLTFVLTSSSLGLKSIIMMFAILVFSSKYWEIFNNIFL